MADTHPDESTTLGEMAARDRRLADAAARDAEVERPVAEGQPDHPNPDIAAADHLRAQDDVRTFSRQEDIATQQAEAAERMEDNQRRLQETEQQLARVRAAAAGRRDDVRALEGGARELRDQTRSIHDDVRHLQPPDVAER